MSASKKGSTISFRFNSKGGDDQLLEEVHSNNYDDESRSTTASGLNSESSSRDSTPMKSSGGVGDPSKLSDVLSSLSSSSSSSPGSSSASFGKVKPSISEGSVKDFFTSKLNRGRSFDHTQSPDDTSLPSSSPGSSSKWFNDSWKKFQQIIEEKKEKSSHSKKKKDASSSSTDKIVDSLSEHGDDIVARNLRSTSLTLPEIVDEEYDFPFANDQSNNRPEKEPVEELIENFADEDDGNDGHKEDEIVERNELENNEQLLPPKESYNAPDNLIREWFRTRSRTDIVYLCSLFVSIFAVVLTIRLPFPSYINGFILGVIISFLSLGLLILYIITLFLEPIEEREEVPQGKKTEFCDNFPETKDDGDSQQVIHKEWFHELVSSQELASNVKRKQHGGMQLVFIRLQGNVLRVSEPQSKSIKARKLTENSYTNFVRQRHYDLINLKRLYLWLPNSVRNKKKYLWLKKYPIILEIGGNKRNEPGTSIDTKTTKLVLFSRTDRSKEEWYWRFHDASRDSFLDSAEEIKPDEDIPDTSSTDKSPPSPSRDTSKQNDVTLPIAKAKYEAYMHQILNHRVSIYSPGSLPVDDSHLLWFNVMLGRVLFEFLNSQHWSNLMARKIQRKLSRIKLPYFMQTLTLKNIDFGQNLPRFLSVTKPPSINEDGVWVDFQIDYCGGFAMTLETKLNLMRIRDQGTVEKEMKTVTPDNVNQLELDDFSDPESIVSSSEDEENNELKEKIVENDGNNSVKILKFVDKLAASKYFQQATDNKYIKRAMEGVSNTPLVLTVFVQELSGVLSLNLPPPPSDRLWYGFRGNPNLVLSARPRLGEHRVSMSHAIEWIEKKLQQEFNKLLVIPNMDDIILPVMMASNSNIDIQ